MRLSNLANAIQRMIKLCGDQYFTHVSTSIYGDFVFETDDPDVWYVMSHKTFRIEKHFDDTWRNPEHKEVIYEGDFQNEPEN